MGQDRVHGGKNGGNNQKGRAQDDKLRRRGRLRIDEMGEEGGVEQQALGVEQRDDETLPE